MTQSTQLIQQQIQASSQVISSLTDQASTIAAICDTVVTAMQSGHKLLSCGYGGSATDALHIAEELTGRYKADRQSLPAIALTADPSLITCIANDYGFDYIFSRQIEGQGKPGDVLVIFSTSGSSVGLKHAIEAAHDKEMKVIALLGKTGGTIKGLADHELIVASNETARIQEVHTLLLHMILEAVERVFVKGN